MPGRVNVFTRQEHPIRYWFTVFIVLFNVAGFLAIACYLFAGGPPVRKHSGRRGDPVSLRPLTMDQAVDAIFAIKPDDVRKILAKRPGKGKKK